MSTPIPLYVNIAPYQEVISGISTLFTFSDGLATLTGPSGVGKSTLLIELIKELKAENLEVVEFHPLPTSVEELHNVLTQQLQLGTEYGFRQALAQHIARKPRNQQKKIALIVDNAEELNFETLLGLHNLRSLQHNSQALVSLLLCGNGDLNTLLASSELSALQEDISLSYTLHSLEGEEFHDFCTHYLKKSGKAQIPLTKPYLQILQEHSLGLPALIIEQLDAALQDPELLQSSSDYSESTKATHKTPTKAAKAISATEDSESVSELTNELVSGESSEKLSKSKEKRLSVNFKNWLKPAVQIAVTAAAVGALYLQSPRLLSFYQQFIATHNSSPAITTATVTTSTETTADELPKAAPVTSPIASQTILPPSSSADSPQAAETTTDKSTTNNSTAAAQTAEPTTKTAVLASIPAATPESQAVQTTRSSLDQVTVQNIVENWLNAWRSQDINSYLALYHTDFAPLYQNTLDEWRKNRTRNIMRPMSIMLTMSDWQIGSTDDTSTSVQFWLDYESPHYSDHTLKELVVSKDIDGKYRILREQNRVVEKISAGSVARIMQSTPQSATPAKTAGMPAPHTVVGVPVSVANNPQLNFSSSNPPEVAEFVSSWLNAWQHKDLAAYFKHYHAAFSGSDNSSHADWSEDRTLKITRPKVIQLELHKLEVVEHSENTALLRLSLEYHSSYYADRTQKEIRLDRQTDGRWQIVMEQNISVEQMPLARLVPQTNVAKNQ